MQDLLLGLWMQVPHTCTTQRMKLNPGLPGSSNGYYIQTVQMIYSGVWRDVCTSLDSWPDLLLGTCPGKGTVKE